MGVLLDGVPWWSQLRDTIPGTGMADTYSTSDCGEECVCMAVWWAKQQYLREDQVRGIIPGHSDHGETNGNDLEEALRHYGVSTEWIRGPVSGLKTGLKSHIGAGRLCIVLGHWLSPAILHWVVGLGYGNDGLVYMDPWSGTMQVQPWHVVESLATGEFVLAAR